MEKEVKNVESVEEEAVDTQEVAEESVKTFTQEEVDKLVQERVNRAVKKAEREAQAKMDEAEKLRKMNAEEKARYESQKQADRIAELEAKLNRNGLEKEATQMLSEAGITANDTVLSLLVKDSAEATQEAVRVFAGLVDDLSDKKVAEMLKGKTPQKTEKSHNTELTKEQFDRMSYRARLDLKQSNPELYNQLLKGR